MADIGKAYVQIEPTAKGISGKIEKEFGAVGKSSGASFSSGFGSVLGSAAGTVGKAVAGIGKVVAGATAAGTAAVGALAKSAVSAYADFEQLEGGAKLLFGDAFSTVMDNADSAFERVQMSANDYLQQANSYATGLKESLGGDAKAAADLADGILVAQADIVAATGQSQEAVSNAFAGIMKNNFMMLDNLAIGIKPTKEGMQEVIDKMNEWNKTQGKVTKYQMGNLADMEAALVDYVSYVGMADYAHKEGANTIQGSLASMKAAWENTLTAISQGDDWDIGVYISNLTKTVSNFSKNLMPIVEKSITGISELITQLAPILGQEIPKLLTSAAPQFIEGGIQLIGALAQGLMDNIDQLVFAAYDIIQTLFNSLLEATSGDGGSTIMEIINWIVGGFSENYMQLLDVGIEILANIGRGIMEGLPELLGHVENIITYVIELIGKNLPSIVNSIASVWTMILETLSSMLPNLISLVVDGIISLAEAIVSNYPKILEAAMQVAQGLLDGILTALPMLIERLPEIIQTIITTLLESLPILINGAIQLVMGIVNAIPQIVPVLVAALPQIIDMIIKGLLTAIPQLVAGAVRLVLALVQALPQIVSALVEAIPQIITSLVDVIISNGPLFLQAMVEIVGQMVMGLLEAGAYLLTSIGNLLSNMIASVNTWLSQLPTLAANYAGQMVGKFLNFIMQLPGKLAQIWTNVINNVKAFGQKLVTQGPQIANNFKDKLITTLKQIPSKMLEIGKDIVNGLLNGIKNAWSNLTGAVGDMAKSFIDGVKSQFKIGSPSKVMAEEVGRWIPAGIAEGIESGMGVLRGAISDITDATVAGPNIGTITSSGYNAYNSNLSRSESDYTILELLRTYLPIIAQGENITVGLEPDSARFFKMMQYESQRNAQLVGV